MKRYISRNALILLAWLVQLWTVWWQVKVYGTIRGDALIPLLSLYGAICMRDKEKAAPVQAHRDGEVERSFNQPISTSSLQKNGGICKR